MPRDWTRAYQEKLAEPAKAVEVIEPGRTIFVGSGAAEPQSLVAAFSERGEALRTTNVVHILTLGVAPYVTAQSSGIFRHNALFIGNNVRPAVVEGRAEYTPIFLSEIPKLFRSDRIHLDYALVQVSPPDDHGFCSLGVAIDVVKAAIDCAPIVIAEVNPRMPRTHGNSFVHVRKLHKIVEVETPILESTPAPPDPDAMRIGEFVAELVEDGSTLQLGIGSIPNAVLQCLSDRKDLGIHTEMFSDGIIDLVETGVITNARKTVKKGRAITSFCIGTRALYDYVHDNPFFEFHPVEYTNDPYIISQNHKMVSVNGALEVDLTGQVCSDSIGFHFYSGIGGQIDFIRGASRSEGGKPIIVLKSTAAGGRISRIVAHLQEGAGVVTTRGDVHYVATEYGVADLWGKTTRERALALVQIAHPKFRDDLIREAKEHGLVL